MLLACLVYFPLLLKVMCKELTIMDITLWVFYYSLWWAFGKFQYLFSLDQVNKLILEYGFIPNQVTMEFFFSLYKHTHKWASISYINPSTAFFHLENTIVFWFIDSYISGFLNVAPSVGKPSICVYSCFSYS